MGLSIVTLSLASCLVPERSEINATLWLNNAPIPKEICEANKELYNYGLYRRLNDNSLEFVSFCSLLASRWISIHSDDLAKLLDKYVPERKKNGTE